MRDARGPPAFALEDRPCILISVKLDAFELPIKWVSLAEEDVMLMFTKKRSTILGTGAGAQYRRHALVAKLHYELRPDLSRHVTFLSVLGRMASRVYGGAEAIRIG